jgi:hypothetical protein
METQNKGGVNQKLSDAGAAQAGIVIRDAILCRLATMIMREFAPSRDGDLHIGRAIELRRRTARPLRTFGEVVRQTRSMLRSLSGPNFEKIIDTSG